MSVRTWIGCCLVWGWSTLVGAPVWVISADRADARYPCGAVTVFQVGLVDAAQQPLTSGQVSAVLTHDGGDVLERHTFSLADGNPFKVSGTLATPGFLRLQVALLDMPELKLKPAVFGSAYEPEKILAGSAEPGDFMVFWQEAVRQAEALPLDAQMEKLDAHSNDRHASYKVSFAAPGGRVYGFYSVPVGPGPFPAALTVPGAGPGAAAPSPRDDMAILLMNVHPYDPMLPGKTVRDSYAELNAAGLYSFQGAPDREAYFFYRAILGINRALNWLRQRPEIRADRLGYWGSSQGGAFGLIMGGLNPDLAAVACNVPAMCDHLGRQAGRSAGWPGISAALKHSPEVLAMAPYFDAVNFAGHLRSPVRVMVGYADTTCCPSSVYAAYNRILAADKRMADEVGMGHSARSSYQEAIAWVIETIKK